LTCTNVSRASRTGCAQQASCSQIAHTLRSTSVGCSVGAARKVTCHVSCSQLPWAFVFRASSQPSVTCPRISPEFLEQARVSMTPLEFASEYGVEFVEGAGSLFALADVDRAFTPGEPFDPTRPLRPRLHLVDEVSA
jgi:hypothetical protein